MNIQSFSAYDYSKQAWITGAPAVALRKAQLKDDLELLLSDAGADYARMINVDHIPYTAKIRAELASLPE